MRHYRSAMRKANEMKAVEMKPLINEAFKRLRKAGYFARQNFWCCQSCGWAAVPDEKTTKAVFYHQQDTSSFREYAKLFLAWDGDGKEIVKIIEDCGLEVEWDGNKNTRILISGIRR